jgi:hypothetical protein
MLVHEGFLCPGAIQGKLIAKLKLGEKCKYKPLTLLNSLSLQTIFCHKENFESPMNSPNT